MSFALLEERFRAGDPTMTDAASTRASLREIVQRPLGGGRPKLDVDAADRRHLGPRPACATRACSCRSTCRRSFVARGGDEPMVRLPSALNADRRPGARLPAAVHRGRRAAGRRPPAVGAARRPAAGPARRRRPDRNRLALPPLPDRWVVAPPADARRAPRTAAVRGWVLEADRAVQVDLGDWPAGSADGDAGRRARRRPRS